MIERSSPGRCWILFSSPPRPDRLWVLFILLSNGFQGLFPWGVKRSETDPSLPSSADVKNAWSCTFTPHIRLHGVVLSFKNRTGTPTALPFNWKFSISLSVTSVFSNMSYKRRTVDPDTKTVYVALLTSYCKFSRSVWVSSRAPEVVLLVHMRWCEPQKFTITASDLQLFLVASLLPVYAEVIIPLCL
jgi:hypothetical protein